MKAIKYNSSLLKQHIILYLMLVFLPVMITTGALFFSYQALENEVIASNIASLQLIKQSLDPQFRELNETLLLIAQDPGLTKYSLQNHPAQAYSRLQETLGIQDFWDNIVINILGEDYFYTAKGNYESETITESYFINDLEQQGYTYQEWTEKLFSINTTAYWPINTFETKLDYLYYFAPLNINLEYKNEKQKPSRNAVILIKQAGIHTLFQHSQTNANESNLLFNSKMELLSHLTPHVSANDLEQLCAYLKKSPLNTEVSSYSLNGEKQLIFITQSAETGLYYVRFLSEKDAFQPLYLLRTYTIIILVSATLIGVLLIFYGIKRNYVPIRTLATWIQNAQNDDKKIKNELVYFKNTFNDIFERNHFLVNTINDSKHSLIDHLLTTLIQGNFSTEDAFQNACRNLNVSLNKKYFAVCSVFIENKTESISLNFEHISKTIYAVLPENIQLQIKDLLFAKKLLLVLSSDTNDAQYYQTTLNRIKQQLYSETNLITSIGAGSFYESYEQIGKSYLESQNAMDYRIIYGKDCLIMPETYCNKPQETEYPNEALKSLQKALISYDMDSLTAIVQNLINYTKSPICSLHVAKYICYDIFSILKKLPVIADVGYTNSLSQTLNIIHLTDFDTVEEFFTSFLTIVQNVIQIDNSPSTVSSTDIGQQLVNYINTHCFAYDFQISNMATYFDISRQYMLNLFKKKTGVTLSEYVTNKKIEKSMQLLRDTDMSLSEIVQEIGNTDVSGFIRSFKRKTGLTPAQYRNNINK